MNTKQQIEYIGLAKSIEKYDRLSNPNIIVQMALVRNQNFLWAFGWHWNTASFEDSRRYCCPGLQLYLETRLYLGRLSSMSPSNLADQLYEH